ncbi:MAG: phosphoribosyltransferase, partial [Deltaproteobacteria bacterium]|nr:phosphoribosyltransferase [Deltaproteobacteria bacterium]
PGGPRDTAGRISAMEEATEVICPLTPAVFYAVSQLYADFSQVEDAEVIELLKEAAAREGAEIKQ